jgi:hypothetical protein
LASIVVAMIFWASHYPRFVEPPWIAVHQNEIPPCVLFDLDGLRIVHISYPHSSGAAVTSRALWTINDIHPFLCALRETSLRTPRHWIPLACAAHESSSTALMLEAYPTLNRNWHCRRQQLRASQSPCPIFT